MLNLHTVLCVPGLHIYLHKEKNLNYTLVVYKKIVFWKNLVGID